MPLPETGKERAARIPLDYYTRPDFLERWKLRLGALAVIAALAWVGLDFVLAREASLGASRGPVASVHQAWDSQCSACHGNFTPISSHSWQAFFLGSARSTAGDKEHPNKCETCHAGPVHHASQKPDLTCASCHRDHQGKDFSLVNLPDTDCTQCHKDLGNHMDAAKAWHVKAKEKEIDKKVVEFSKKTHPPFRSIEKDPGKLRFNHKRHLAPGMALEEKGEKGDGVKRLGDIPSAYRERYRSAQAKKADADLVQLNCASCHQLDSGDFSVQVDKAKSFPFSIQGQRGAGAYMLPIVYDNQCIACHPLEHKLTGAKKWTIPHRSSPEEIHDLLDNFFTAEQVRGLPGVKERKPTVPLPFKLPPAEVEKIQGKVKKAESELFDHIDQKIGNIEREFYKGNQSCALCHYFEGPKGEPAANVANRQDLKIVPTRVPQVWFQHAKFNHTAHRAVDCESCHDKARGSTHHAELLIPDRDNCVQCHAPGKTARFHCTECHRYHNGDQPVQGIGAQQRNPAKRRSIDEFLRGSN